MRRTRRSTVLSHVTNELDTNNNVDHSFNIEQLNGTEDHANIESQDDADPPEALEQDLLDIPPEVEQEIWESLKEEFYEPIEQLPLSLHRSFTLIGEQDREAQSFQNELLPTIRSYIKLRQFFEHEHDCGGESGHMQRGRTSSTTRSGPGNDQKRENSDDVIMGEVRSNTLPIAIVHAAGDLSNLHTIRSTPQLSPTRGQGGREADATIPKSVPFPPRAKPKTVGELLTRITFLTSELLRASDEKVGLATVAYDLVDRHVQILNTAIKDHEGSAVLGLREGTRFVETTLHVDSATALSEDGEDEDEEDEDEEPQLGMIGPAVGTGVEGRAGQRLRKNKRKDRRKHDMDGQPPTDVAVASVDTPQELSIDPDEPRYCYCNQVSYGEMIACDNPDCNREWFHLGCAGLTAPPKGRGKWYCRDCEEIAKMKKKKVH